MPYFDGLIESVIIPQNVKLHVSEKSSKRRIIPMRRYFQKPDFTGTRMYLLEMESLGCIEALERISAFMGTSIGLTLLQLSALIALNGLKDDSDSLRFYLEKRNVNVQECE